MSVWTTRALEKERHYIVFQHTLKGVNHEVQGVKFRNGYAVVEKDSKTYFALKKIPVLKSAREYPLVHLRKLNFITRAQDIRQVYGQDVYVKFLSEEKKMREAEELVQKLQKEADALAYQEAREKEVAEKLAAEKLVQDLQSQGLVEEAKAIEEVIPQLVKCSHRTQEDKLCDENALEYSPSGYCGHHLFEDSKLSEYGLEKPNFMTKEESKKFREKVKTTLKKAKKDGKF